MCTQIGELSLYVADFHCKQTPRLFAISFFLSSAEIDAADEQIPLPNVSGKILAKVVEYCKYHVEAEQKDEHGEHKEAALSNELYLMSQILSVQDSETVLCSCMHCLSMLLQGRQQSLRMR